MIMKTSDGYFLNLILERNAAYGSLTTIPIVYIKDLSPLITGRCTCKDFDKLRVLLLES